MYSLFAKGLTIGVFQFESSGMREFLKKLKPTAIEDLIAMNALYRPGPMKNIDDFISRKHGKKKIDYPHASMEEILSETYGIICLLYTSPSPRDKRQSRMPSSA